MAAPVPVRPNPPPGPGLAQSLYRLTVSQLEAMIERRMIGEEERVELIEGLLIVRGRRSRAAIVAGNKGLRILWRMVPTGWHVAKDLPILLSDWSRPEPDLAIIRGVVDDYEERHPTAVDVGLVVEVAGADLSMARADLARVYAAAGIPTYWIVNLVDGQVEILSEPRRDGYQSQQVMARGQDVPVVIAGLEAAWIAVSDLLP